MSCMTRLMAAGRCATFACCATSAAAAGSGCVRGVTYHMPMPNSLTLGTIRGDESAKMAASAQPAATSRQTPTTRPTDGLPRSADAGMMPVSLVGR